MFNYSKQNFFYVMVVVCFGFLKVDLSEKVHFREIRNKKRATYCSVALAKPWIHTGAVCPAQGLGRDMALRQRVTCPIATLWFPC